MNIRALEVADVPTYRALMLDAYASDPDAFTSTPAERLAEPLSWWQKRVCDPGGASQAFGTFDGERLVGAVAIEYSSRFKVRHKASIVGMIVTARYRGRGAGRDLLSAALDHARARDGIEGVALTVTDDNLSAIRLYEDAGFTRFGVERMAVFTGTEYKSKIHMQLLLSAARAR
ncbi:MAG TPA: GNAT family N-acetyltransferase [Casimicrobiaceae bacterium]|nr:GNAT family N-acetyltransferase [Casimicrobiaceae bacterium]